MESLPFDLILQIIARLFGGDMNAACRFAATCRTYRRLICAHMDVPNLSLANVAKWTGIENIGAFRLTVSGDIVYSAAHVGEFVLANSAAVFPDTLKTLNAVFYPPAIIGMSTHTDDANLVITMAADYAGTYPPAGHVCISGTIRRWDYPGVTIYTFYGDTCLARHARPNTQNRI